MIDSIRRHAKYARYLGRHKLYVMLACWRFGLFTRGVTHDLSKLRLREWLPYCAFFYGEPLDEETYSGTVAGISRKQRFDRAWLEHQKCNEHHWQYWILKNDDGRENVLPMPREAMLEMLADWFGAGKAITGVGTWKATRDWYEKTKGGRVLNPSTRSQVEYVLDVLVEKESRRRK